MERRKFIKIGLSGTALVVLGVVGLDKLPVFEPEYGPVVITKDDVHGAMGFFTHFDIKCPKFEAVVAKVLSAPEITPRLQHELKVQLCRTIASNPNRFVQFKEIVAECARIARIG